MSCDDKETLVHALADGELDVVHANDIEAHMARCSDCAAKFAEIKDLKQRLSAPGLRMQAPTALAQRIAQTLPSRLATELRPIHLGNGTVSAPRKRRTSWILRAQGALAGAGGAFALAACLALFVMHAGSRGEVERSLIDGHLRSLAGEHLFDVQSTDQHTVKPWFAGKLDVTPPVPDLALKGFTLIGGRVDYVGGRAAAVVVYRRRKHVINLFVWPGTEPGPPMTDVSGYTLRHWTKDGLTFWAVSDIAEPELAEFETAYQAAS
jgi:anti-sigma factor RsiW